MSKSPGPSRLFLGLTFWVSRQVPERQKFTKILEQHGGTVLQQESTDSYNLVNPETQKSSLTSTYYDYKFVTDSLDQRRLLDENDYEFRGQRSVDRIPGSVSMLPKATRTQFTAEDDQILFNWLEPLRQNGGFIKGNKIYEQLARVYPHHTVQSWRDHYIKIVMNRTNMRVTEHVGLDDDTGGESDERPMKRRRVQENLASEAANPVTDIAQSTIVHSIEEESNHAIDTSNSPRNSMREGDRGWKQERPLSHRSPKDSADQEDDSAKVGSLFCTPDREVQELSKDRFLQTSLGGQAFDYNEASKLYLAVPLICDTTPTKREAGWISMASEWNKHSVEEWKAYYEYHILPEYKRANGITSQEDLDAHVAYVVAKLSNSTSDADERLSLSKAMDTHDRVAGLTQAISEHFTSQESKDKTADPNTQELNSIEPETQESSGSTSKSTASQRAAITANEGRKRVVQQANVDDTHSPPVAPAPDPDPDPDPASTPLSQKKKLFGRSLGASGNLSQTHPVFVTQSQTTGAKLEINSSMPVQSNISSTGKTNTTTSSLSLPTVYKPPQSFQLPPQSLATSQESAQYDTALQVQGPLADAPEEPELPERVTDLGADDAVVLLDDERTDSEPDLAELPPSDTGSEYMAFETQIERSQMWETESYPEGEMTDLSDEEILQDQSRSSRRQATHVRQNSPSDRTNFTDNRDEENSKDVKGTEDLDTKAASRQAQQDQARVETQALFEKPTQSDPTLFDLPDPDGGWDTFGVIDDPDKPIETVELPDSHPSKQRRSSSVNGGLGVPGDTQNSPVVPVLAENRTPIAGLPVRANEVALKQITSRNHSVRIKEEIRIPRSSVNTPRSFLKRSESVRRPSTSSNVLPNVSTLSSSRFGQETTLASWMAMQREKYHGLPDMIFKRLASTASQAINLNSVTTATLLLEKLVDTFIAYEHYRQTEYKQRHPASGKRLKPTSFLSSAQAKQMLPTDIRGVWTPEDDDRLLSSSRDSIRRNETKHGADGVQERIEFLKSRYNLKTDSSSPVKSAMTPSSGKRKR